MEILNRKAYFEYTIIDDFTSGIVLLGPEVKSVRKGEINIGDSYIFINNNEVYVKNMHISRYKFSLIELDELRDRKLLLKKSEIKKLSKYIEGNNGLTAIPLKLFLSKGKIKMLIGVGKGKKLYNKKLYKQEQDIKRETDRELKTIK